MECCGIEGALNPFPKRHYDTVTFSNGYAKDRDQFVIEWKGLEVGKGNPEWGAPGYPVFKIKLGEILSDNFYVDVNTAGRDQWLKEYGPLVHRIDV